VRSAVHSFKEPACKIAITGLTRVRHPSPGQSVPGPGSRLRRRYADPPAAALLTGLGAGGWSPLIAINYNIFEFGLALLLEYYAAAPVSEFFFDRINNQERIAAIQHFSKLKERDPKVISLIDHLLSYFSTCSQNRNILMHSKHSEGTHPAGILPLEKRSTDEPARLLYFYLLLPELRRVADQTMRGVSFLKDILEYLRARDTGAGDSLSSASRTLPRKPRSPRLLEPEPTPAAPEAE
jgi:hypothetical protein